MTGPAIVSIARIAPDLARQHRDRVRRIVARDDPRAASDDLRCLIAVFGHGEGVPESIDRVRRVLAAGTLARLRPHIAVETTLSGELKADAAGTLYVNWAFKPGTPDEVVEDIYIHTLPLAVAAAVQNASPRVTWPRDDEIAARVMTAAAPPRGGVQ